MFQFPGFPSHTYGFSMWSMALRHRCSHIRISADHGPFASPRSFSQLVTSFVGSQCQGILHMLFLAWTTFRMFLSFDLVLFSLELLWSYIFQLLSFFTASKNCSFLPAFWVFLRLRKNLISSIKSFSLYYVCHVYENNFLFSLLFGFQWTSIDFPKGFPFVLSYRNTILLVSL